MRPFMAGSSNLQESRESEPAVPENKSVELSDGTLDGEDRQEKDAGPLISSLRKSEISKISGEPAVSVCEVA
jgi:hypothetical protein